MKQITQFTNDFKQILSPTLEDGTVFEFSLNFKQQEEFWMYSIKYKNLIINNCKLVLSSNLLHQWKNILPFGLLCTSTDSPGQEVDPFLLNDLSSGRVKIFIMTTAEVTELENQINGA